MFVFVRAITYATLFIGVVLVFLPAQVLSAVGAVPPKELGAPQFVGLAIAIGGGVVALWCVSTFASAGRGTPAPFDPPRHLVIQGPYAVIRNPMYAGAGLAIAGAALFYESLPLAGYAAAFAMATHLLIVHYEEPALLRSFGAAYESYCRNVGRWSPRGRPPRGWGAA